MHQNQFWPTNWVCSCLFFSFFHFKNIGQLLCSIQLSKTISHVTILSTESHRYFLDLNWILLVSASCNIPSSLTVSLRNINRFIQWNSPTTKQGNDSVQVWFGEPMILLGLLQRHGWGFPAIAWRCKDNFIPKRPRQTLVTTHKNCITAAFWNSAEVSSFSNCFQVLDNLRI